MKCTSKVTSTVLSLAVVASRVDCTMNKDPSLTSVFHCSQHIMLQCHPRPLLEAWCYRQSGRVWSCVLMTMSLAWSLFSDICLVSSSCCHSVNFLHFRPTLLKNSLTTPALFRSHLFVLLLRLIGSCICAFDWHKSRWLLMTFNCYKFDFFLEFRVIPQIWEATVAKRMKIDAYCQRRMYVTH